MNKNQKLKHAANIGLASLMICSLIYYSTIQGYYKNDIESLLSMIVGSIVVMSFFLSISYSSSSLIGITKYILMLKTRTDRRSKK
jgi:hypothetical protein